MSELEDIKLKALLQEMKLESTKANFSVQVMSKIFEEESVLYRIKKERILGTGFWLILLLFIILFVAVVVVSGMGILPDSELPKLFPEMNSGATNGCQMISEKLGTVPLSIAGILGGVSILLFLDRFITSNTKVFCLSKKKDIFCHPIY